MCQLKWQRKKKKSRKIEAQYSIGVSACDQIKGCQALKCWISFPHDNFKGPYEPSAFPRHCSPPAMVLLPSQLETTSQTMWNTPHQPPPCFQPSLFPADAWAQPGDTACLHHVLLQKFCTREALCKCFVHAGQMWWNHGEKKAATVLS